MLAASLDLSASSLARHGARVLLSRHRRAIASSRASSPATRLSRRATTTTFSVVTAMASKATTPPNDAPSPSPPLVLDAHLHVWPTPTSYAYVEGKEPPASLATTATAEALVRAMDAAGIHGALIVQPINLLHDHAYVADVVERYPGRFVACALADPTRGIAGVNDLSRLLHAGDAPGNASTGTYRAVRFNPGLWPEARSIRWSPYDRVGVVNADP